MPEPPLGCRGHLRVSQASGPEIGLLRLVAVFIWARSPLFGGFMKSKLFLVPGLLFALGSTLSWNPEITQLARIEKLGYSFEFASNEPAAPEVPPATGTAPAAPSAAPAAAPAAPAVADAARPVVPPAAPAAAAPAPRGARPEQAVRFGEIDLGEADPQNVGTRVRYARNQDKIVYRIEGVGVCSDCIGVQTTTITGNDLTDLSSLNKAIAQHAIARLREVNPSKPGPAGPARPNANDVETNCNQDLKDGLIACQTAEVKELLAKCNSMPARATAAEKSACFKRVDSFFRKHLAKNMQKGLNAQINSELYIEAKESRDELLADLPSRYDDTVKQQLSAMTTQGVLRRAEAYNNVVQAQCQMMMGNGGQTQGNFMPQQQQQFGPGPSLPGQGQFGQQQFGQQQFQQQPANCATYAANQAKSLMINELQFTTGPQLRSALLDANVDGDSMSLQQMYMSTFHNPLMNVWNQNSQNGINWSQAQLTPGLQTPGLQTPGVQNNGGPVLPGTYDARNNGNRGTPGVPQAYGQPNQYGAPVGTNQPNNYRANPQTLPQQNNGFASPTNTGLRTRF